MGYYKWKSTLSPDCKLKNESNVPFYAQFEHGIEELARKQTHIFKANLTLSGISGGTNGTCVEPRKCRFKECKIRVSLYMNDQTFNKVTYIL